MTSLFARPVTWNRLYELILENKGVLTHGVYVDGQRATIRNWFIMHPMYWRNLPWSITRGDTVTSLRWEDIFSKVGSVTHQDLSDAMVRDLADFEQIWLDDPNDGIEVQYN
jgi:hypothetical protein